MKSRFKKFGYLFAASVAFLLLILAFQFPWFSPSIDDWLVKNLVSAKEDFPRKENGRADLFEFYNLKSAQGVTPDDNFVVDLIQVFGTSPHNDTELNRWLKPETDFPTESRWVSESEIVQSSDEKPSSRPKAYTSTDTQMSLAGEKPWTCVKLPQAAAWLDANKANLDLIQNASRKRSKLFFPLIASENESLIKSGIYPADKLPGVARAFAKRALNHMGEERYSAALDDLQTMRRLGELVRQPTTLLTKAIGASIDNITFTTERVFLDQKDLTTDTLKTLQDIVRPIDTAASLGDTIAIGERLLALSSLQEIEKDTYAISTTSTLSQFLFNDWTDRAVAAEIIDAKIEELARHWNEPDDVKRLSKLAGWTDSLFPQTTSYEYSLRLVSGSRSRGALLATLIQEVYFSDPVQIERVLQRAKAQRRVLETAIAIKRFQLDNDRLPDGLDSLVPAYLSSLPIDCFTGKTLRFHRSENGFRIYSLGPNRSDQQIDNNGSLLPHITSSTDFDPNLDDIVIDLGT